MSACKYGDPYCPCQDGDPCHYEGDKPMPLPGWDAVYTPADVWEAGRVQGVVDAARKYGPKDDPAKLLAWIVMTEATDENPYEGVGDAHHVLHDVEALLDDCDQVVDTPERPNLVAVWGVRKILARYGGAPHRWQVSP